MKKQILGLHHVTVIASDPQHSHHVTVEGPGTRFDEEFLASEALDGLPLELEASERTARRLTKTMGFRAVGNDGHRVRYAAPHDPSDPSSHEGVGSLADLGCLPTGLPPSQGQTAKPSKTAQSNENR